MPLFGRKTVSAKCAALLTAFADENIVVELEQLDPDGRVGASGKTRIRSFDRVTSGVTIDLPSKGGRTIAVGPGDLVRVFIIRAGQVHKFESVIIEREQVKTVTGQVVPMLRLEAPENLENGNRRRHFRVSPIGNAQASCSWRLASRDRDARTSRPFEKSAVQDISGRGIAILVDPKLAEDIEEGRQLELQLKLQTPHNTETISTRAIVRRTVPSPDGIKNALFGIEFAVESRDPDACLEQVVSYVTFCQIEIARNQREREQ
ncbi:PilZ domain-containing protein [bacterium]|jgi:c-di-GMP-binding flagellar brake protein YcgR|nr:PilZ domain-containing protein [bacterium]